MHLRPGDRLEHLPDLPPMPGSKLDLLGLLLLAAWWLALAIAVMMS